MNTNSIKNSKKSQPLWFAGVLALWMGACGAPPAFLDDSMDDSMQDDQGEQPSSPDDPLADDTTPGQPKPDEGTPDDTRPGDETNGSERNQAINALVFESGNIDSPLDPDTEPKPLGDTSEVTIAGDTGAFQCSLVQYSLTKKPDKFVVVNPNAGVLWPGALVQGKSIDSGLLDPILAPRAPGFITLDLVSGAAATFSAAVAEPRHATVTQAVNDILHSYLSNNGGTPAKFSYSFSEVHSKEHLSVAIGANAKGGNWEIQASLGFNKDDEKSRVLLQFNQEYYTVAFEPERAGAAGFFRENVTASAPFVGPGNPPAYVASVTYGRTFYLLFESTKSAKELHAAISGSYNSVALSAGGSVNADWTKTINESSIKSYGVGGDAQKALDAASGGTQFEKVRAFLVGGANFSLADVGVPISYTLRYPGNGAQLKIALTTEFTAKDCRPVGNLGCDGVPHSGAEVDACGVCGGDGTGCAQCASKVDYNNHDHGTWVNFQLPNAAHGTRASWQDGIKHKYIFPTCRRVFWRNMAFTCENGNWVRTSGETGYADALCHNNGNTSQSGITTFAD